MKKKGFTLIELLAVIVILAIIALIATPLVLKYIEKSRQESKVDSAYSFIRNLETEIANYSLNNSGKKYTATSDKIDELIGLDTKVKGENPEDGRVCISSVGQIEKGIFKYGKYYVSYDGNHTVISNEDNYNSFSCNGNVTGDGTGNGNNNSVVGQLDYTVAFMVGNQPYEIVSVKAGNVINAPATPPTLAGYMFNTWKINGEIVKFPYQPQGNTEITADFLSEIIGLLYKKYSVSIEDYPYVFIILDDDNYLDLIFASDYTHTETSLHPTTILKKTISNAVINNYDNVEEVVEYTKNNVSGLSSYPIYYFNAINNNYRIYTNADLSGSGAKVYNLK